VKIHIEEPRIVIIGTNKDSITKQDDIDKVKQIIDELQQEVFGPRRRYSFYPVNNRIEHDPETDNARQNIIALLEQDKLVNEVTKMCFFS